MEEFYAKRPVFRQVGTLLGRAPLDPQFAVDVAAIEFQFLKNEFIVNILIFMNQTSLKRYPGKIDKPFAS